MPTIWLSVKQGLFPACAGVILMKKVNDEFYAAFPRMRGGDPRCRLLLCGRLVFSPHARG